MNKIKENTKTIILNGEDVDFASRTFELVIENENFEIGFGELYSTSLVHLIDTEKIDMVLILKEENFHVNDVLIKRYVNEEHMKLYGCIKEGYLIICSMKEIQPMRFISYLECVWLL